MAGLDWKQLLATAAALAAFACSGQPEPKLGAPSPPDAAETAAVEPQQTPEPSLEEPGARVLEAGDELEAEPDAIETAPEGSDQIDPETLLHEALDAYESAEAFWQQGAFDDAFAALDHAYELMLELPAPGPDGDPVLAQEKENLRNLVSRRIVEIYASRQTAVGDPRGSIPVELNEDVVREIESFTGREREFFLASYRRSGAYRPMIVAKLAEAGMPEQLSWLPLVESGFKARAYSSARALGLWQFIASTGYRYGLERNSWVDERMDPEKATDAAIGYLTALHNLFGDWLTALAAYNCGERNVLRQIENQKVSYFDQFWDLYARLPHETRRYVPRFLAVLAILEDPAKYGIDLPETDPPLTVETIEVARATQLEALDAALGLAKGTLAALNPELRRNATPDVPYSLRIPAGSGETVRASLESLPKWTPPKESFGVHRVRRGETLSGIASRYRTSVSNLMSMNRLRSANRIYPGQQLRVPGSGGGGSVARASVAPGQTVEHRVRTGDSLWLLASRYGTTVDRIKRDNDLRGNTLQPGQRLTIRSGSAGASSGGDVYVVQRGDTLGGIAAKRGVPLSRLLAANQLSPRSTIYPGQRLTIPD